RIDEAPDQPWTSNAIDLWPRACYPDSAALRVARRQFRGRHKRKFCSFPAFDPTLKHLGPDIHVSQPGGRTLRKLLTVPANDDGTASSELVAPLGDLFMAASDRARNKP